MTSMSPIRAIKTYFEADPHGRTITMDELKGLSGDERRELGQACCAALGVDYEEPKAA